MCEEHQQDAAMKVGCGAAAAGTSHDHNSAPYWDPDVGQLGGAGALESRGGGEAKGGIGSSITTNPQNVSKTSRLTGSRQ